MTTKMYTDIAEYAPFGKMKISGQKGGKIALVEKSPF